MVGSLPSSPAFSDSNLLPVAYGGEPNEVIQFTASEAIDGFWVHPQCAWCNKVERTVIPAGAVQWRINASRRRHQDKLANHGDGICKPVEEEAAQAADVSLGALHSPLCFFLIRFHCAFRRWPCQTGWRYLTLKDSSSATAPFVTAGR